MDRLDYYDIIPDGMSAYLSNYGFHFSKKLCEWAISNMRDRNNKKLVLRSKEEVDNILKSYGIELNNNKGYDAVYVFHMAMADFVRSSISDELGVAKYVKDYLDDEDGYEGIAFTRFIADCNGKGIPIIWADVI